MQTARFTHELVQSLQRGTPGQLWHLVSMRDIAQGYLRRVQRNAQISYRDIQRGYHEAIVYLCKEHGLRSIKMRRQPRTPAGIANMLLGMVYAATKHKTFKDACGHYVELYIGTHRVVNRFFQAALPPIVSSHRAPA